MVRARVSGLQNWVIGVGIEGVCFHNHGQVTYVRICGINVQLSVHSIQIGAPGVKNLISFFFLMSLVRKSVFLCVKHDVVYQKLW